MDAMSWSHESDAEPMSTDMLDDICDRSQSHPSINRRKAYYKIHYCLKKSQVEWKGALLSTQKIVKVQTNI